MTAVAGPPAGAIAVVSSRHNPLVRLYRVLARERAPEDQKVRLLLDGLHLLAEARTAGLAIESAAFAHRLLDSPQVYALAHSLAESGTQVVSVPPNVLAAMSPVRTPSGVVAVALGERLSLQSVLGHAPQLVVIALDVQDAGNFGAIVRATEAAGGTGVVACGASADPFGWKALRGSMGSILRLPSARADLHATVAACRAAGLRVVATVPRGGRPLFETDLRQPVALILGGEGRGLPEEVVSGTDERVSVPMQPPVDSLNVAVAAAVLLYEARRQRSTPAV